MLPLLVVEIPYTATCLAAVLEKLAGSLTSTTSTSIITPTSATRVLPFMTTAPPAEIALSYLILEPIGWRTLPQEDLQFPAYPTVPKSHVLGVH